jgi:hypothetical protein
MNQVNHRRPPFTKRAMNAALWTTQVLWGAFFSITGFGKVSYQPDVWKQTLHQVAWSFAVPQDFLVVMRVCEFLGGVGLIMPAMAGVKPKLTPFSALLPDAGHDPGGWISHRAGRVRLSAHQSCAGRGRRVHRLWMVVCQAQCPPRIGTLRVLKGLAVLGLVVLVGFAPVGYKFTPTR